MQHLAVIYAGKNGIMNVFFPKCYSLQQFELYGGKTAETNIWLRSIVGETDLLCADSLTQAPVTSSAVIKSDHEHFVNITNVVPDRGLEWLKPNHSPEWNNIIESIL